MPGVTLSTREAPRKKPSRSTVALAAVDDDLAPSPCAPVEVGGDAVAVLAA